MTKERVHFSPNVPVQLGIIDLDGEYLSEPWGDQIRYTTTDGRYLYTSTDTAAKINMLDLRPGEQFVMCKRWNGERRQAVRWDVWRPVESEKQRAVEEAPALEQQLRDSLRSRGIPVPPSIPDTPPVPRPQFSPVVLEPRRRHTRNKETSSPAQTLLPFEESLANRSKVLVDTYASTLQYSSEKHGNSVKPEDIRSLTITAYISMTQRNGGHGNAA